MKASRQTKQKVLLEQELRKISTFFDAEKLYDRATKRDPNIGIATVYRFLKELLKKGDINSYICNRRQVYSKHKSHAHFVCEKTGKVIHFDVDSIDFLKDKIPGSITSFQIEVRGVCDNCKD